MYWLHPHGHQLAGLQVEEPVYFVDFLREPEVDEETGEVVDAHPSFYEGVTKGLPEVKTRVEALQVGISFHNLPNYTCPCTCTRPVAVLLTGKNITT